MRHVVFVYQDVRCVAKVVAQDAAGAYHNEKRLLFCTGNHEMILFPPALAMSRDSRSRVAGQRRSYVVSVLQ